MRKYQKYKEYSPTTWDVKGLGIPNRGEWFVVGFRSRDTTERTTRFNYKLKRMGGESETVEVHRFGHWACGWFEIILKAPKGWVEPNE